MRKYLSKNTSHVICTDLENVLDTKTESRWQRLWRLFMKRFAYGAYIAQKEKREFCATFFSSVFSYYSSSFSESASFCCRWYTLTHFHPWMRTHFVILSFFHRSQEKNFNSTQTKLLSHVVVVILAICLIFAEHFRVFPLPFFSRPKQMTINRNTLFLYLSNVEKRQRERKK